MIKSSINKIINECVEIDLKDCVTSWEDKLKEVYPPVSDYPSQEQLPQWATSVHKSLSDIRKATSNRYEGNRIPWGINQYYVGCALDMGEVKDNFQEVLNELTD